MTAVCWVALIKRWWRCWSRCRWVRAWTWCCEEDTRCFTTPMDVPNRVWRRYRTYLLFQYFLVFLVSLKHLCLLFCTNSDPVWNNNLVSDFFNPSTATDSRRASQHPQCEPQPDTPHLQPNTGCQRQHARSDESVVLARNSTWNHNCQRGCLFLILHSYPINQLQRSLYLKLSWNEKYLFNTNDNNGHIVPLFNNI